MPELTLAFLGDVVGSPGRRAIAHALPLLRERHKASLVIVNGENSRNGSGLSPDSYRELRRAGAPPGAGDGRGGVNAVTLGDHCYRDRQIIPTLSDPAEPVARPANLAARAPGKRLIRLETGTEGSPLYILTVLGRLFMPVPADSPFDTIDRELRAIPEPGALVLVEVHAEATSEKVALAWYCLNNWTGPGKPAVIAVLGTHTHVQTADARILEHRLAAMTDVGMSGPHRSVIGRHVSAVLEAMSTQAPIPLDVASDDVRAQGCVITLDTTDRRAVSISPVDIAAG